MEGGIEGGIEARWGVAVVPGIWNDDGSFGQVMELFAQRQEVFLPAKQGVVDDEGGLGPGLGAGGRALVRNLHSPVKDGGL